VSFIDAVLRPKQVTYWLNFMPRRRRRRGVGRRRRRSFIKVGIFLESDDLNNYVCPYVRSFRFNIPVSVYKTKN
jgi:hypothetical protein